MPTILRARIANPMAILVAAVSAASLLLQYILLLRLERDGVGPWLATLRYVSYFTILANLLVVAATVAFASSGAGRMPAWLARPRTLGAAALYIGVTGITYTAILRHLWQPQGAQWWADSGLHYATPVLYVAWWLACAPHGALCWGDVAAWLMFPAVYLCGSLLRGAWLGEYPYPFIDVAALGMTMVLRNAGGVLLLFLAIGAAIVAIDRAVARNDSVRPMR